MLSLTSLSRRDKEMLALALTEQERRLRKRDQQSREHAWRGIVYSFRGGNAEVQLRTDAEMINSGPSETGKTIACLYKLNTLAQQFPGARLVIARKKHVDLQPSVLQTFEKKILGATRMARELTGTDIRAYGGERVEFYEYPNGSRIWTVGLDNPSKVLSAEFDMIYVNQAEELTLDDWETLTTRVTGRAGTVPNPQLLGDSNPSSESHWIVKRAREGKLVRLKTTHRDNPTLYDDSGEPTEQGARTLERLSKLSGHRRKRFFEGLDASPEGLVYDNFTDDNLSDDQPNPELTYELSVDDGYNDPRAIYFIQRTSARILVFDEIYHSQHHAETCVRETVERCGKWFGWLYANDKNEVVAAPEDGEIPETWTRLRPQQMPEICVGSPEAKELQLQFRKADIPFRWQAQRIKDRIDLVRRLICDDNGYRTLLVRKECENLIREFTEGYQYPANSARGDSDLPIDAENHAADSFGMWALMRARR